MLDARDVCLISTANERSGASRALHGTVQQTEESIFEPVAILDLAKRGHSIAGRLLAPTHLGYQIQAATPLLRAVLLRLRRDLHSS